MRKPYLPSDTIHPVTLRRTPLSSRGNSLSLLRRPESRYIATMRASLVRVDVFAGRDTCRHSRSLPTAVLASFKSIKALSLLISRLPNPLLRAHLHGAISPHLRVLMDVDQTSRILAREFQIHGFLGVRDAVAIDRLATPGLRPCRLPPS